METKGLYKLSYTIDKKMEELVLSIELKQVEGSLKSFQNVWEAKAILNGKSYEHEDLKYCVNAKYMAEHLGLLMKLKLKTDAKKENKSFKIKKEEIL